MKYKTTMKFVHFEIPTKNFVFCGIATIHTDSCNSDGYNQVSVVVYLDTPFDVHISWHFGDVSNLSDADREQMDSLSRWMGGEDAYNMIWEAIDNAF